MRYGFGQIGSGLVTLLGMSVVIFLVMRLLGDPLALYLPITATTEQREIARHAFGLDRALPVQYADFISKAVVGDLGTSLVSALPVRDLIGNALFNDILLVAAAFAVALPVGVLLGVLAASRHGVWASIATGIALVGQSVPSFWVGIVLILIFSTALRVLPAGGVSTPLSIVLPALTLAIYPLAGWVRLTRAAMTEILQSE